VESTTGSIDGSPASRTAPLPPGDDGTAMDVDKSADGEGKDSKEGKDTHAPVKKYKMTEAMKGLIWNLVCLSNECCRIENEKKYVCWARHGHRTTTDVGHAHAARFFLPLSSTLEGSASLVSEQGLRKALYQKIVAAFPDGWMSSGQVSREGEYTCGKYWLVV